MSRESRQQAPNSSEFVEFLSGARKVELLLSFFDLSKDKDKIETRKKDFLDLLTRYHETSTRALINSRYATGKRKLDIKSSNEGTATIHNKIMSIIVNLSLSVNEGITPEQRGLATWLSQDRQRVADMIRGYFLSSKPSTGGQSDPMLRAMREDSPIFFSSDDIKK